MGFRTKIFAVAGNPVLHSRSPALFNAAFRELSMNAVYTRLAASTTEDIIASVRAIGLAGVNITSPFKEGIISFLDHVDLEAQSIGAVNTVVAKHGKLTGYNTDHVGVRNAFLQNGISLFQKKAVVLGAGGAARAAVFGLIQEGARVVICNRTPEKALQMALELGCRATTLGNMDEELRDADILLSCLPSLDGRVVDTASLTRGLTVLDANYQTDTQLSMDARANGCRVIDGREWLLFQGIKAFAIFTGFEPPLDRMRSALYRKPIRKKRNTALIGFMGTGKTSVARDLGRVTGRPVVDMDRAIEEKAGHSIGEIFALQGESRFRAMERDELGEIAHISRAVVACGGGVVLDGENIAILKENCIVTWLWADEDTILDRLGNDKERPLLTGESRALAIGRMLTTRLPLYARASDLIVRTDGRGVKEIAERIKHEDHMFLAH
jgi:shikimate dehydrogenase